MSARPALGRHVFGVAVVAYGVVTLAWPDYYDWLHLSRVLSARECGAFDVAASAAQIGGGAAIQFSRIAKSGAALIGIVYLVIALLSVLPIIAAPLSYNPYGNFFEQLSLLTGAALGYGRSRPVSSAAALRSLGRVLFGVCLASFALEQWFYLGATASLVPAWLPPSRTFWAIATTGAFGLAAAGLLTNRMSLTAIRLTTLMLVLFGLVVWVPLLVSDPHDHSNWTETAETFAIAGTAWILADLLGDMRPTP